MTFPFLLSAAPMAGISNRAFRDVVRAHGAQAVYGEMISARALAYGNKRTWELMDIEKEAEPRIVQISGCEPDFVEQAAQEAVRLGAQELNLNMGCPAPKVVRNNEGAHLMRHPQLAVDILKAACSAGVPVSCKIRSGWDEQSKNAVEFALKLQNAGAAFIVIHGRTREQFYSGTADWQIIADVKQALDIPVIGNGDIFTADDAVRMLEQTDCDGIMVGRGMLGNPWIFRDIQTVLSGGTVCGRPEPAEILETVYQQLINHIERTSYWVSQREGAEQAVELGESLAIHSMRGHLGWYTKGLRDSAQLRLNINRCETLSEVRALFDAYLHV